MSDIDMRFDGILLLAALALGVVLYLLVALVAGMVALLRRGGSGRAARVAGVAALMALATAIVGFVYFGAWAQSGTAHFGTDWADLMVLPWAAVFIAGCWGLTRVS